MSLLVVLAVACSACSGIIVAGHPAPPGYGYGHGEEVRIPPGKTIRFKPGKDLQAHDDGDPDVEVDDSGDDDDF